MLSIKKNEAAAALLNTNEAAAYLSVSAAFLTRDRWLAKKTGNAPRVPVCRIGGAVRYRRTDLDRTYRPLAGRADQSLKNDRFPHILLVSAIEQLKSTNSPR